MSKAKENSFKKADFEILFIDSPEYFLVSNAKFIQEQAFVRFICFDGDTFKEDIWFPINRIHRIKRYAEKK